MSAFFDRKSTPARVGTFIVWNFADSELLQPCDYFQWWAALSQFARLDLYRVVSSTASDFLQSFSIDAKLV